VTAVLRHAALDAQERLRRVMARRRLEHAVVRGLKPVMPDVGALDRSRVANYYLCGEGLEIGALHRPLLLPDVAHARYVDRFSEAELRRQYAELSLELFVPVDIIDDGERLDTIANASQDFVVANHFLEHCQNPILALRNMLRVLRPSGVLYLAIPDKRFTFDVDRPLTTLEHVWRDYDQGPALSRRQHFEEFVYFVQGFQGPAETQPQVDHLLEMDYSIHFHVWTQFEQMELLRSVRQRLSLAFDVELMLKNGEEVIFILRSLAAGKDPSP
jgi:predicted SAM-dependent methyltransferase